MCYVINTCVCNYYDNLIYTTLLLFFQQHAFATSLNIVVMVSKGMLPVRTVP